jgi:hypothetical protein
VWGAKRAYTGMEKEGGREHEVLSSRTLLIRTAPAPFRNCVCKEEEFLFEGYVQGI